MNPYFRKQLMLVQKLLLNETFYKTNKNLKQNSCEKKSWEKIFLDTEFCLKQKGREVTGFLWERRKTFSEYKNLFFWSYFCRNNCNKRKLLCVSLSLLKKMSKKQCRNKTKMNNCFNDFFWKSLVGTTLLEGPLRWVILRAFVCLSVFFYNTLLETTPFWKQLFFEKLFWKTGVVQWEIFVVLGPEQPSMVICSTMVSFTSRTTKCSMWPSMDPLLVPSGKDNPRTCFLDTKSFHGSLHDKMGSETGKGDEKAGNWEEVVLYSMKMTTMSWMTTKDLRTSDTSANTRVGAATWDQCARWREYLCLHLFRLKKVKVERKERNWEI